ncbi:MAG: protein-glutamate O-methyltransferase [Deltaproteobacteria bacterium]|nr:protein-glutamate O-methyltransferase [Deltaproteobacteria bacterium]
MFDDLTDNEFELFSKLIYTKAGINLHTGKKELLRARLAKRLRSSNFHSFREYYDYVLQDKSGEELVQLLDSISTNLTSFFRESKHFQFLADEALPGLLADKKRGGKIRIWSAGCSSGEEPYSLVMTILEHKAITPALNLKILATDISTRVLATAEQGIYPEERCKDINSNILKKYFQKGQGRWQGYVQVKPMVRNCIQFMRHNLMEPGPWKEPMDIIFCRNVMIYFDKNTQEKVVNTFYSALGEGGYLFIGHSESLTGTKHAFKYARPTVYQKK